jgi:hypothetical protein
VKASIVERKTERKREREREDKIVPMHHDLA